MGWSPRYGIASSTNQRRWLTAVANPSSTSAWTRWSPVISAIRVLPHIKSLVLGNGRWPPGKGTLPHQSGDFPLRTDRYGRNAEVVPYRDRYDRRGTDTTLARPAR